MNTPVICLFKFTEYLHALLQDTSIIQLLLLLRSISLVRSKTTFCSPLQCPNLRKHITSFKNIHLRNTKFIFRIHLHGNITSSVTYEWVWSLCCSSVSCRNYMCPFPPPLSDHGLTSQTAHAPQAMLEQMVTNTFTITEFPNFEIHFSQWVRLANIIDHITPGKFFWGHSSADSLCSSQYICP